jgi:arylsulfatase A-like enzyme
MRSLLLFALLSVLQIAHADSRPNILWFIVDDMSAHLSCYGETTIQTPAIDSLAQNGTKFTRAYITAPVCSPCRSALITGMYQTSIGAHHHRSGRGELKINLPDGVEPVPLHFQRAGYYTCIGSGLKSGKENAKGKRRPSALGKTDYNFEWPTSMYDSNDWAGRAEGQPFFMQVQLAGGKHRGQNGKLAADKQAALGSSTSPAEVKLPAHYPDDPVIREDWAAYLDSVRYTDHEVGKVLSRLQNEGLLDQTVIIFMTDHGISHARGKQFLYDEGMHVPLIIKGPGVAAGKVRDDLVSAIDLAPLSLALAAIPIPQTMQGKNILAEDYVTRGHVFAARDRCDETTERLRAVRTVEWKYIRNYHPQRPALQPNAYKDGKSIVQRLRELHATGQLSDQHQALLFAETRPAEELYRLSDDPGELNNVAADAQHAEVLNEMRAALDQWITATGDKGEVAEGAMYDSDMALYLAEKKGAALEELKANIAQMKRWQEEGK